MDKTTIWKKCKRKSGKYISSNNKTISKERKTDFFCADDEMQLLFLSYWLSDWNGKCEYRGVNWESIRSKYERVGVIIVFSCLKN